MNYHELYGRQGSVSERSGQQNTRYDTQDINPVRSSQKDLSLGSYGPQDTSSERNDQEKMSSESSGGLWTEFTSVPPRILSDPDIQEMALKFRKETKRHQQLKREVKEKQERLEKLSAIVKM